jgi:hypothetical protein
LFLNGGAKQFFLLIRRFSKHRRIVADLMAMQKMHPYPKDNQAHQQYHGKPNIECSHK